MDIKYLFTRINKLFKDIVVYLVMDKKVVQLTINNTSSAHCYCLPVYCLFEI